MEYLAIITEGVFYVFSNTSQLYYARYGEKISNNVDFVKFLLGFTQIAVIFGEGFKCFYYIRPTFATSMENIKEGLDRIEKANSRLE